MIIANPIYDVTFKRILENDRAAKFLIGTILDCEVISLVPNIQERTYEKSETRDIALFRMDYSATIKTKTEGEQKVVIEVQKSLHPGDIERFRGYLGAEYMHSNLPIISIYILGFNLSTESPAFAARPDCRDLQTHEKLEVKDAFVQQVTHAAYFIQTLRIKPNYNTRLEKLLSLFEQANFIGMSQTTKALSLTDTDPDPDLNVIVNILQYIAADDQMKDELAKEEYYHKAMEAMFGKSNRDMLEMESIIIESKKEIAENKKEIAGHKKELAKKDEKLAENKKELAEKDEKLRNVARELKQDGVSSERIAKITGLSAEEIEKI